MYRSIRTDLALEARQLRQESEGLDALPGIRAEERRCGGFPVTTVEVLDARGEEAIGKPCGTYITVELDGLVHREENAFSSAAQLLADQLRTLVSLEPGGSYLVAGLGNRGITPDAVGPETVDHVLVTRHLKERLPEDFASFIARVKANRAGFLPRGGEDPADGGVRRGRPGFPGHGPALPHRTAGGHRHRPRLRRGECPPRAEPGDAGRSRHRHRRPHRRGRRDPCAGPGGTRWSCAGPRRVRRCGKHDRHSPGHRQECPGCGQADRLRHQPGPP